MAQQSMKLELRKAFFISTLRCLAVLKVEIVLFLCLKSMTYSSIEVGSIDLYLVRGTFWQGKQLSMDTGIPVFQLKLRGLLIFLLFRISGLFSRLWTYLSFFLRLNEPIHKLNSILSFKTSWKYGSKLTNRWSKVQFFYRIANNVI